MVFSVELVLSSLPGTNEVKGIGVESIMKVEGGAVVIVRPQSVHEKFCPTP